MRILDFFRNIFQRQVIDENSFEYHVQQMINILKDNFPPGHNAKNVAIGALHHLLQEYKQQQRK